MSSLASWGCASTNALGGVGPATGPAQRRYGSAYCMWLISAEATTALYMLPIHGWPSEKIADTACLSSTG
ncbi:hypothetical protein Y032_0067g133 [Ancylostoma ceylanicum]|uniref:Uncharacterized protein n=1 Tax=Ancylostoma ceylanicum TaxID=53326 RepID=A0A016U0J6_9BILA|nr:hypothetical protein Y032_0067g133 [Ancylostoma ceylanicum]